MTDLRPHIKALDEAEIETRNGGRITYSRTGPSTFVVSCLGYNHDDLHQIELKLLSLGCRYDFQRGIRMFDRVSNRTYSNFAEIEPE